LLARIDDIAKCSDIYTRKNAGVLLRGFTDLAKISFQTEIVYANPFGKLETPAFLSEQFLKAGPEFAVAIGCALRRLSEIE
jgi:Tfp pilus assembly PilM family ATPase